MTYRELLQRTLDHGMPVEKALEFLRGSGASPVEAARALQETTGASFEEARALVARTRAWSGPRSGVQLPAKPREWYGAIGQHGRSGHGAASVLPHLGRQTPSHAGQGKSR
ncbi:hypothetical protein EZ313_07005 [Ramlibacter henchirensis]|uniref:Uncharacterized protein n=1 Tax=Ramlibacter henchirensis TaxID=204072 RepID=A0A4Z0C659_9BURK|nr:hypothetical protein [Ramlibacter henchirensis]TFZ06382.1 hypothetical protein EZ313_07005 [Ramlibacter henchirensis]